MSVVLKLFFRDFLVAALCYCPVSFFIVFTCVDVVRGAFYIFLSVFQ